MQAELIAIGSELLLGEGVDTNSAWISARLAEIGVDVYRHTTVGDNVERMLAVLGDACRRADVVIVTGGLGPTHDDLTRTVVAKLAGVELERHDDLADRIRRYFAERRREMPESNLVQADIPAGARVLEPVGTAPGFAIDVDGCTVYCVPGVPREMEVMVARDVIPELVERAGLSATISRTVRTAGMSESGVAEAIANVIEALEEKGNPTIALLASRGETRVRVTAKAPSREAALVVLKPVIEEVVGELGAAVVGIDDEGVEAAIGRQLRRLELSLAVGESITAGGVAARLVTMPGASDWFRGGIITYATETKVSLAGIDPETLKRDGPVAESTAAGLARGAAERLGADVGLGIVGVAGPTPQGGKDVGTCWVAVALPDRGVRTRLVHLPGRTREDVQEFAASAALDYLRRRLAEWA